MIPGLEAFKKEVTKNEKKPKAHLGLSAFTLNGGVEKLKKEMKNAVYVLDGLALKGEFTVFSAPPNGGKTLLTIAGLRTSAKVGRIDGNKVFYINSDDNQRGAIAKTEIVESLGINMVVPVLADRKKTGGERFDLVAILKSMIETGKVDGEIIVLDTLKKFVSVMKKDDQSEFNNVLRNFVSMGGTVIVLAHTNKRRVEGKHILGGTSDLLDDCDCCWVIDPVDSDGGRLYNFNFTKGRGVDGEDKAFFVPTIEEEDYTKRYRKMLDSVVPRDAGDRKDQFKRDLQRRGHQAILLIQDELQDGTKNRTALEKAYGDSDIKFDISRRDFQKILKVFSGDLWKVNRQGRSTVYSLNPYRQQNVGSPGNCQIEGR